jgi:hypothetical protein
MRVDVCGAGLTLVSTRETVFVLHLGASSSMELASLVIITRTVLPATLQAVCPASLPSFSSTLLAPVQWELSPRIRAARLAPQCMPTVFSATYRSAWPVPLSSFSAMEVVTVREIAMFLTESVCSVGRDVCSAMLEECVRFVRVGLPSIQESVSVGLDLFWSIAVLAVSVIRSSATGASTALRVPARSAGSTSCLRTTLAHVLRRPQPSSQVSASPASKAMLTA